MGGHLRVCIHNVKPELDCGKTMIKRIVGETVKVTADIFADGHDKVDAVLLYRKKTKEDNAANTWKEKSMVFEGNDCWSASFKSKQVGVVEYTIEAWVDHFSTWQFGLKRKFEAGNELDTELKIGVQLIKDAIPRASVLQKTEFLSLIVLLEKGGNKEKLVNLALSGKVSNLMYSTRDRVRVTRYNHILQVLVERKKALFSTWYEFFPRSTSPLKGIHGTFKTSENILPEIAKMGFDVIYLPPIHPIGTSFRKGINNAPDARPDDPGSPWAIGSIEGGHKSIHPQLGSMDEFKSLLKTAGDLGMDIALDFAIQCSPDHPYVKDHPQWFKWRPDGTVQYAENPPKKYQDVLPINFETEDWESLWQELKSIVEFWIDKGITIFRVDNPHTKSFHFWEWLIKDITNKNCGIIFLAEAFTRPRVMEKLAKIGFTQSYTYFTWRNSKKEFQEYLHELTKTEMREYFRPNFWPNTPDILPSSLEGKEEPSFLIRLILAGTLSSNYGLYGPLFELGLNDAYPGKEEYNRSEKYEIKHWDWFKTTKIKEIITLLNNIRKENKALQNTWNIEFCETDNDQVLSFIKIKKDNKLLIAISLDPLNNQSGYVKVPLKTIGIAKNNPYSVFDLFTGVRYIWENEWNYIALHPSQIPAHIFRIEHKHVG